MYGVVLGIHIEISLNLYCGDWREFMLQVSRAGSRPVLKTCTNISWKVMTKTVWDLVTIEFVAATAAQNTWFTLTTCSRVVWMIMQCCVCLEKGSGGLTLRLTAMGPKKGAKVAVWQLSHLAGCKVLSTGLPNSLSVHTTLLERLAGHCKLSCPSCEGSGIGHR